jgi:hypothetical protein
MPRAYSPPLVATPTLRPFTLDSADKLRLAHSLGLNDLPSDVVESIAHTISCCKATHEGSKDTTVANTIAALRELFSRGRLNEKAVRRIADDRCGVDYTTHLALQPLAKAVLAKKSHAVEALAVAVQRRIGELEKHPRVLPSTESLRFFCGVLRVIFNHAAASSLKLTTEDAWRNCRKFALEVFTVSGVDHPDFDSHPDRLTEYLGTDVAID